WNLVKSMVLGSPLNHSTPRLRESCGSRRDVRIKVQAKLGLRLILVLFSVCLAIAVHVQPESIAFQRNFNSESPPLAQPQEPSIELRRGDLLSRDIAGGKTASFKFSVPQKQYFCLLVNQQGVILNAELFGSDGKSITRIENVSGAYGPI